MPRNANCPQGHQWDPGEGATHCPICGSAAGDSATTITPVLHAAPLRPAAPTEVVTVSLNSAPAPPSPTLAGPEPPHRVAIPGYEVFEELGRGGMGVVYKARQQGLNRLVALKMILAGQHAGTQDLARFYSEAESVARLQHPNIVQVHEVGEHDGLPFFSLEFVEGGNLAQRLTGRPWTERQAAELVEVLARAMHYAHQHGIIHRDLKPANILLTADGVPKITDFGLAKHLDSAGTTRSGAVLGTPPYMAPEQAGDRSKQVGPHTDVYALGALLYELLTARPPFQGETTLDTVMRVLDEEPVPPRAFHAGLDPSLEAICLKCLEKEPQERYPSAEALAGDLAAYLRGEPVAADGSTSRRLFRLFLRESRHTEVMAQWGRVWMWHAVLIFLVFALTDVLITTGVVSAWPYITLWSVSLAALMFPVWYYRFRSGLPLTPVERQLGQIWGMFAAAFVLTTALNYFSGKAFELEVSSCLPVLVLECGLGFGCMAVILGGSFYGLALTCAGLSLFLAFFPRGGPIVFGVVFLVGLFVPAWRYTRAARPK